jgi:hypothetical protein
LPTPMDYAQGDYKRVAYAYSNDQADALAKWLISRHFFLKLKYFPF